jgi:hypothetical protein
MDDLYTEDNSPRWILNLKVISEFNLMLLKELSKEGERLTYSDMGHLLMTGALWEDQIATDADLPSKGEEMIAVFYVREVLMCTNITLIPRRQPDIYLILVNQWTRLMNLNKLLKT